MAPPTPERSAAAFEIARTRRLGVVPDGDGWRCRTAQGAAIGPAAPSAEEALEATEAAIVAGEGRKELQELRAIADALARGRYYVRPVEPSGPQLPVTFTVVRRDGRAEPEGFSLWRSAAERIVELDATAADAQRAGGRPGVVE